MAKTCTVCSKRSYGEYCMPHKPRKPIQSLSVKPKAVKAKTTKKKAESRSQLKNKAWKAFSDYIRLRDCLLTTGTPDNCICITCNERGDPSWKPYKQIQAGHAVGGRSNAILFHEEIVNGQCGYCNQKPPMGLGGDYGNYAIALIKRHGLEHVEQLQALKRAEKKLSMADLREITTKYKEKRAKLLT